MKEQTYFQERDNFVTLRHVTIDGTNFEIGRQLGELARERYGAAPEQFRGDPLFASARRVFLQEHYPIHWQRMRGLAAALDVDPSDDRFDLSNVMYHMDIPTPPPGCSAVYYPPSVTATGSGYLGRNYDFSTGSFAEMVGARLLPEAKASVRPVMSEPYIMSWCPTDGGYASLAIHAFDLLSGTLDGINSAGLIVCILADDEARRTLGPQLEMHQGAQQAIGLHELQVMRLLLDTCSTAEQAALALLTIKQYYRFTPNHYLVADRAGHSFVYENSTGRNVQHVIEGHGQAQVVTNHQLNCHPPSEAARLGSLTLENNSHWRHQTLRDRLATRKRRVTVDDVKADLASVNVSDLLDRVRGADGPTGVSSGMEVRTVWRSVYDQETGTAEFSFYLGDAVDADGVRAERRSEFLSFALAPPVA